MKKNLIFDVNVQIFVKLLLLMNYFKMDYRLRIIISILNNRGSYLQFVIYFMSSYGQNLIELGLHLVF